MRIKTLLLSILAGTFSLANPGGPQKDARSPASQDKPAANHGSPFACNRLALSPEARKRHFDELGPALRARTKNIRELKDGYEFEFPYDAATVSLLTQWAAGEHLCCPFFDISVTIGREGGPLSLRLTGREGIKQFIKLDFATWFLSQWTQSGRF